MGRILALTTVVVFVTIATGATCPPKSTRALETQIRFAPLGQAFSLCIGETARIDGENLSLTFTGVTRDSRCPKGVECIVAGEAVAVFSARLTSGPIADLTFKVAPGNGATNRFQGFSITITELAPYPEYNQPINPADYSTKVLVERY